MSDQSQDVPPTSGLTRTQRALVALEAAKEELRLARREDAERARESTQAARAAIRAVQREEGAKLRARQAAERKAAKAALAAQGAAARMVEDEAAKAAKVGFPPDQAREGARVLQEAGFVREKGTWVRDELRVTLSARGWLKGASDGNGWNILQGEDGRAPGNQALRDWIRQVLPTA